MNIAIKLLFLLSLFCVLPVFPIQISQNNYQVIDLTHTLDEKTPTVPGKEMFQAKRTCWADTWNLMSYQTSSGIGTHMDAPRHRIKTGMGIAELEINNLVAPCYVLDMRMQCLNNHDYQISRQDILDWEKKYGTIAPGNIVIANTGWSERWYNQELFRNCDVAGTMHFPGFSASAAELLLSRGIVGLGIDTFSLDPGNTDTAPVHQILLAHGIYFIECLANINNLPATGALVCSLPLKLAQAPEAPVRVIALIPEITEKPLFSNTLFSGKIALISGGGNGIGKTIAQELLKHGAHVIIVDKDFTGAQNLISQFPYTCTAITIDLRNENDCRHVRDNITQKYNRLDILINNAAINDNIGLSENANTFRASLEKNLVHYFTLTHYAQELLKQSQGTIINIASKVGITGQGNTSGYAASKGAILALTREWAIDFAPYNVRVNAIIPAEVSTDGYTKWLQRTFENPEEKRQEIVNRIPLGQRMTTPEEITHGVLFLAPPLASHITGEYFFIDGGYVHLDRACTQ